MPVIHTIQTNAFEQAAEYFDQLGVAYKSAAAEFNRFFNSLERANRLNQLRKQARKKGKPGWKNLRSNS